jgi:hypothetical protein
MTEPSTLPVKIKGDFIVVDQPQIAYMVMFEIKALNVFSQITMQCGPEITSQKWKELLEHVISGGFYDMNLPISVPNRRSIVIDGDRMMIVTGTYGLFDDGDTKTAFACKDFKPALETIIDKCLEYEKKRITKV